MLLVGAAWQRSILVECRIEWIEDGLVPRPLHKVLPVDDNERKSGPPSWEVTLHPIFAS